MRGPQSLRERLALGAVFVTAVALAVLTAGFNVLLASQLRSGTGALLSSRAEAAAAGVDVGPDGHLTLRTPALRAARAGTWVFEGDRVLVRAGGDSDQQEQAAALVGRGERTVDSREPEAVRYYALPLRSGRRQVGTVVSSVVLDPYERVADLALVASVVLAGLVLGGAYLLVRTLVGRALTPVATMTEQAARWSASDLERRFGAGARPTELAALATTLDGVLDRLAAALRHEQQLSAELSHELRTPLAAVVAEVELLDSRRRTDAEVRAGHDAVLAAAERMGRVLESLLAAARATTGTAPGRCRVAAAVEAAVASLQPSEGAVRLRVPAGEVWAGVDAALLERALAPVLDNGLRHCRSQVRVDVGRGPDGPFVRVCDDGDGVDPALRDTLFEPGVSGVAGVDGPGGSGLGLALARRLARAGGGDLVLQDGSAFLLTLPTG